MSRGMLLMKSKRFTDLLRTSGPLRQIKWAPDSAATACAMRVFPVPDGPWSKTPRGGGIPEQRRNVVETIHRP